MLEEAGGGGGRCTLQPWQSTESSAFIPRSQTNDGQEEREGGQVFSSSHFGILLLQTDSLLKLRKTLLDGYAKMLKVVTYDHKIMGLSLYFYFILILKNN